MLGLGGQLEPAKARTIHEQQLESASRRVFVDPFECVCLRTDLAADEPIRNLVGPSQNDINLAAIGFPTGPARLVEVFGGEAHALKELLSKFVDWCGRQRI